MGIQINGQTDTISATDGSFTISGASGDLIGNLTGNVTGNLTGNVTSSGISTFSDTVNVGAGKSIRLYGATSGFTEIVAAAGSASTTFTLPANGGSASQYLQTDGSGGLSWQTVTDTNTFGLTHLTTVSTSSVSTVTITGIPSTATMVYVNIDNFGDTVNNSSRLQMRVGNGSVDSGANRYTWNATYMDGSGGNGSESSTGSTFFRILHGAISGTLHKNMGTIQLLRTNDRGWIMTALLGDTINGYMQFAAGRYDQNTAIDRVYLYNEAGDNISDGSLVMVSYQ